LPQPAAAKISEPATTATAKNLGMR